MFPGNIIKKMRTEDLRGFFLDQNKNMTKQEARTFEDTFFNKPPAHEFLVERKKNKLKFIDF